MNGEPMNQPDLDPITAARARVGGLKNQFLALSRDLDAEDFKHPRDMARITELRYEMAFLRAYRGRIERQYALVQQPNLSPEVDAAYDTFEEVELRTLKALKDLYAQEKLATHPTEQRALKRQIAEQWLEYYRGERALQQARGLPENWGETKRTQESIDYWLEQLEQSKGAS